MHIVKKAINQTFFKTGFTRSQSSFNITPELFQCVFPNLDTNLRTHHFHGLSEAMIEMEIDKYY